MAECACLVACALDPHAFGDETTTRGGGKEINGLYFFSVCSASCICVSHRERENVWLMHREKHANKTPLRAWEAQWRAPSVDYFRCARGERVTL